MEHWENIKANGYRFVWDESLFRPGTDTFLLSSFPRVKGGLRVCDFGCGTGLLALLLLQRCQTLQMTGIDIQPQAISLAQKAAAENGLTDRLTFQTEDLRKTTLPAGSFDLIVCNPPYYPSGSGKLSASEASRIARSELSCTLEELCQAAARLLRWDGRFCLVHKPERLTDVIYALRQSKQEPKRLRFVCKNGCDAPSLFLLEACRGGKSGLTVEPPLILQNPDGTPTAELDSIYFRTEDVP